LENYAPKSSSAVERFLLLLKMRGPQPASVLAKELGMTGEGARLQLVKLQEEGLVHSTTTAKGVGRPTVLYALTEAGNARFPNTHAELTVQLLQGISGVLGPEALDALITNREQWTTQRYAEAMQGSPGLEERLTILAQIRTAEGYMAEWQPSEAGYLFIENHCPICAAAQTCQGFCRAELNTFRQVLGEQVQVERTSHILAGARRCAYLVTSGGEQRAQ
jgi:predicted ArsR family transcriptional regulator